MPNILVKSLFRKAKSQKKDNMLKISDPKLYKIIKLEEKRQRDCLELIPSENYVSKAVLEALGSVLTNKYSEGYPGKRYYGGNQFIDMAEELAIERAKKIFKAEHVNVQPYSGSPANLEVYFALLKPGDKIMGMSLAHGGHLTHGSPVNFSGKIYQFIPYGVNEKTGYLDYDQMEKLAKKEKPKMIVCGATCYPRLIDFKKIAQIAHKVGAYCLADIAHIAGLIAAGLHPSPFPYADVVTTTTHKTLRGPRGAMIMCKKELAEKIDKAVFPGMQGGPHDHQTAAIAVCLGEILKPEFKKYARQIIKNAKVLAEKLKNEGMMLISGGTDNHLILIDVLKVGLTGKKAQEILDQVGITVNKNMIPGDSRKPFDPSGIRLGTPAITSRGMKEKEMIKIGQIIASVLKNPKNNQVLQKAKKEVREITKRFPVYPA
jgi:glycine hydroxymethyltransferase